MGSELDPILSGWGLGFVLWNILPLGLMAVLLFRLAPEGPKQLSLFLSAVVAGALAVEGTGCVAMWWCEPDAQLAIIWLVLPPLELLGAGGAYLLVATIELLWIRVLKPRSHQETEDVE
jgi:hypothetical protein